MMVWLRVLEDLSSSEVGGQIQGEPSQRVSGWLGDKQTCPMPMPRVEIEEPGNHRDLERVMAVLGFDLGQRDERERGGRYG